MVPDRAAMVPVRSSIAPAGTSLVRDATRMRSLLRSYSRLSTAPGLDGRSVEGCRQVLVHNDGPIRDRGQVQGAPSALGALDVVLRSPGPG